MVVHKGCRISLYRQGSFNGFVWEDLTYGAESDDVFQTIEEAKADIDKSFDVSEPQVIHDELYA